MSLGFLFLLTTLGGIVAAVARAAGQGGALALAAISALGFTAACFSVFIGLFLCCRLVAYLKGDAVSEVVEGSPFSADQLPPQILPPRESRS